MRRGRAEWDLERFFRLSPEMLCLAGFDGRFKRVNPAFERALGYSAAELLSRPFIDFVHPDDRALTAIVAEKLGAGGEIAQFENRYMRRDGSARWLQWSARAAPEEGVVYAAARDVTERKQLEAEQAALRRLATAVAQGVAPESVFASAVAELHAVVAADATALMRYEADGSGTYLALAGVSDVEAGARFPMTGGSPSAQVWLARGAVRADELEHLTGPIAERLRANGLRSGVGTPIFVNGRLWGVMVAAWKTAPAPVAAETRVAQFTDLMGTAIANTESRAELIASRARIVATADETRRRIERDLHDGAQQRLVMMTMRLRALNTARGPERATIQAELEAIATGLDEVLDDLRDTATGLHPVILSRGGLAPALKALGRRSPLPVEVEVGVQERLAEPVEVAAYYVVAEALTNATKHARASFVRVIVGRADGDLHVGVEDDGIGGADPGLGSGLVGIIDRVEALGGRMELQSPPAGGTTLRISLPLGSADAPASSEVTSGAAQRDSRNVNTANTLR